MPLIEIEAVLPHFPIFSQEDCREALKMKENSDQMEPRTRF